MLNPKKKYNLEYYVSVVDKIVAMGAHVLGIKDSLCPYLETVERS
jgi:pyruvate carboxylase